MEKDLLSNDFSLYTILQGKIHYEKHSHLNNRRGFILEDTSSEFYNYKSFNQTYNLIFLTLVRCLSSHKHKVTTIIRGYMHTKGVFNINLDI